MLSNAVILAALSASGLMFTFKKLPPKVQKFLLEHHMITEIITFLATYATLGGSLTALFAGAIVSTVQSIMFHIYQNPEEYEYIFVASDWLSEQANGFSRYLNAMAKEFKATQAKVIEVKAA